MKRILAAILALTLVTGSAFSFKPIDPIEHTLASIVLVQDTDPDSGEPTTCTGFVVAPHRALTASHCIHDAAGFTVDGEPSVALKRDKYFALVMVSPASGSKPALALAKRVRIGDRVYSFGFAWAMGMFTFGRGVASIKDGDFALDGPLAPGMSGGPVVNLAGEIVGINQAANNVIGIVCGAGELREFISTP